MTTIEIDSKTSELISTYCAFKGIKKKKFISQVFASNNDLKKFSEQLKVLKQ